jgi:AcrR family transcriptional regulator
MQVMQNKRPYSSRLRASQAEQTRVRILEALAEEIADGGMSDFSIDQIARRAGVSPRTVYHHFPNRDALLNGVTDWLDQQVTGEPISENTTARELFDHLAAAFEAMDAHEGLIRAQLLTELGQTVRRRGRSRRRPAIEFLIRREAPGASEVEVRRTTALVHYLASSEAWRSMKDESGMSGREAGEAVIWAIGTLLARLNDEVRVRDDEKGGHRGDG